MGQIVYDRSSERRPRAPTIPSLDISPDRRAADLALKIAAAVVLFAAFADVSLRYIVLLKAGGDDWKTGDWMIHLHAGPIRRGLVGEIVLRLDDLLPWGPVAILGAVQLGLWWILYFLIMRLIWSAPLSGALLVLLLAPTGLLFPFLDFHGALRKEIVGYIALTLIALRASAPGRGGAALLPLAALVYAVAVFAHEINTLAAPLIVLMLFCLKRRGILSESGFRAYCGLFLALAASAFLYAMIFPGVGMHMAECNVLLQREVNGFVCAGAMTWLDFSQAENLRRIAEGIGRLNALGVYSIALAATVLPFLLFRAPRLGDWAYFGLVGAGFALTLPLYALAIDWGRWVHVAAVWGLIVICCLRRTGDVVERADVPWFAGFIFPLFWSVPNCCSPALYSGAVEALGQIPSHIAALSGP